MKLQKEQRARAEFEQLKAAAANAALNNNIAKDLMHQEFHEGTARSASLANSQRRAPQAGMPMGTIRQQVPEATVSDFGSEFDANNRTMSDTRGQTTLRGDIQRDQIANPYTEYDKKFYNPPQQPPEKEYLNDTSKIMVALDGN